MEARCRRRPLQWVAAAAFGLFPTSAFALTQCPSGTGPSAFLRWIAGVVCALGLIAAFVLAYRQRGWRRLLGLIPLVVSVVVGSFVAFRAILHCVPRGYEPAFVCADLRAVDEAFQQSADPAERGAVGASADCEDDWGRARDELAYFEYRELVSCALTRADLGLDSLAMRCPGVRGLRRRP